MNPDLTYAIGDVHGCHDLLLALLSGVVEHAAGRPYKLMFLGDYIDRGPDSAGVIQTVRHIQERLPESLLC
jgi:serine/threonine protein phosphatase 1